MKKNPVRNVTKNEFAIWEFDFLIRKTVFITALNVSVTGVNFGEDRI